MMLRGCVSICAIVLLPAMLSVAGDEDPADAMVAIIDSIHARWQQRTARLGVGRQHWELASQARSEEFGIPSLSTSQSDRGMDSVEVNFDPESLCLKSMSLPVFRFGKPVLPNQNDDHAKDRYRRALLAGFRGKDFLIPDHQQYSIQADAYEETHAWETADSTYPSTVTFPAGSAGPLQFYDWSKTVKLPLPLALIEALQLGLHPELRLKSKRLTQNLRLLNVTPEYGGRTCRVVEFDYRRGQAKGTCRLWLDPKREDIVIRAIFTDLQKTFLSQYDLDYDQSDDGNWWPSEATVLQANNYGDVYDEVQAVRADLLREAVAHPKPSSSKSPSGARIREDAMGIYFYVPTIGLKEKITPGEAAAILSGNARSSSRSYASALAWRTVRQEMLQLVTWPRILLVIPFAWLGWLSVNRLQSRIRRLLARDCDLSQKPVTTLV